MKQRIYRTTQFLITLASCLFLSITLQAGLLDAFEKDDNKNPQKPPREKKEKKPAPDKSKKSAAGSKQHHSSHKKKKKNPADVVLEETAKACVFPMGRNIGFLLAAGGYRSYEEACWNISDPGDSECRQYGDPLIPFVRADLAYRHVNSNIDAIDYRLEGGFGPLAIEFSHSIYNEMLPDGTKDQMDLMRISGLYRMYLSKRTEIDIGMGALTLSDNRTESGFSLSIPALFYFNDYVGVEFRPAWADINGTSISEYDIGLLFGRSYAAVKTGYRMVKSGDDKLDGPYGGISVRF